CVAEWISFSARMLTRVYTCVVWMSAWPMHRLDEPNVRPVLRHLCRHRVPEQVATADVAQPRRSHAIAHHLRHPVRTTDFKYNQRLNITANRRTVTPSIAVNVARAAWAATHTTR